MKSKKYSTILQEGIDRIQDKGDPLVEVLSTHPEYNGRLSEDLEFVKSLVDHQSEFDPRPGFISSSRENLVNQISAPLRNEHIFGSILQTRHNLAPKLFLILSLVFLILFSSAGIALASEGSLPGDRLYPIRSVSEGVRLTLSSDFRDAQLHLRFAQDYLVACADLLSQGRSDDALTALQDYDYHMSETGRTLLSLSQVSNGEVTSLTSEFNQTYLENLQILSVLLPGVY